MCYNCGCLLPEDPMGSDDNITDTSFEKIAKQEKKTKQQVQHEVLQMLEKDKVTDPLVDEMFVKATKVWGQTIEEAKTNTRKLLSKELKAQ